jgi:hypothetical protein
MARSHGHSTIRTCKAHWGCRGLQNSRKQKFSCTLGVNTQLPVHSQTSCVDLESLYAHMAKSAKYKVSTDLKQHRISLPLKIIMCALVRGAPAPAAFGPDTFLADALDGFPSAPLDTSASVPVSIQLSRTFVCSCWHVLCDQAHDHCRYLWTHATG